MANPYRPKVTLQDMVDKLDRDMEHIKREIGKDLAPALKDISDELSAWLDENTIVPTRRERFGLWLARCPAVPWRRLYSESGGTVMHQHGLVTGAIVSLGRWLSRSIHSPRPGRE